MVRRRKRSHLSTIREINMTPLIDLTFLLLIVFMITVPLMEYSVDVSPPEMNANPIPDKNSFNVDVNSYGHILFQGIEVSAVELSDKLKGLLNTNRNITILLRADGSIAYRKVVEVLKIVKNTGIKSISLVTQAES
jgi:biopolymer transport protein TolR